MFRAEQVAVTIAPLLPLGVIVASLAFISRRLIAPNAWAIAPALLMFAWSTLGMVAPLRIDHHGWQLALMMVMVSGLVMRRRAAGGAVSGLALGLSLAIGIELQIGRAHVCTPVTNAHLVCRLLLENKTHYELMTIQPIHIISKHNI